MVRLSATATVAFPTWKSPELATDASSQEVVGSGGEVDFGISVDGHRAFMTAGAPTSEVDALHPRWSIEPVSGVGQVRLEEAQPK